MVKTKICGIRDAASLKAACDAGASMVGFVFYPQSPRAITPQLAASLARQVPTSVRSVGLFVDADDEWIENIVGQVPLDMIQLHGQETPERVREIFDVWRVPVIKAVKIAAAEDLSGLGDYVPYVSMILFDYKPPHNVAALPGGNGLSFDWTVLQGQDFAFEWMLSGGLHVGNVAEAMQVTGARNIDVSSGVETRPGVKDSTKIKEFISEVRKNAAEK